MKQRLLNFILVFALVSCTPAPAPLPGPDSSPLPAPQPPTAVLADTPLASTATVGIPATPLPTARPGSTATPVPASFFDEQRLFYQPNFYVPEIQAFLDRRPGSLKAMRFQVGNRRYSLAEVIVGQAAYYGVNPQVILALIESQSSLISDAAPSADQLGWAVGFRGDNGNWRGVQGQIRWAVRQMFYARRDYPSSVPLTYADDSKAAPLAGWTLSEYVLARVLAATTTPGNVVGKMQRFRQTFTNLFGDPRLAPIDWPGVSKPFLRWPLTKMVPISSFFDHDAPFLSRDPHGSVVTYWGRAEMNPAFAYDGHDGWDYAAAAPDKALAAAAGQVIYAGNADDGCATQAVIVDHGNGYRTLYWHLARIDVDQGQAVLAGDTLGIVGESGCALGPHLHFGTQFLGRDIDPYGWCGKGIDPWQANPSGVQSIWLWADRPTPCGPPPIGAVVVDSNGTGFSQVGTDWQQADSGYAGSAEFTASLRGASTREPWHLRPLRSPAVAIWQATIPKAGWYRVLAYLPYALSGLDDSRRTEYRVRHGAGESLVTIDAQTYANDWADLGTYEFGAGEQSAVILSNQTESDRLSVWADAVMWLPAEKP
jgi:murein DD-endopeptidase MepM/ murein hydrolase activator NlpD